MQVQILNKDGLLQFIPVYLLRGYKQFLFTATQAGEELIVKEINNDAGKVIPAKVGVGDYRIHGDFPANCVFEKCKVISQPTADDYYLNMGYTSTGLYITTTNGAGEMVDGVLNDTLIEVIIPL